MYVNNINYFFVDCLEMIFRKSIESLIKYENEEFYTSFSLWEEQQINEEIEKILNKRYSNSEEIIGRFHALNRSFRDISVCIFSTT